MELGCESSPVRLKRLNNHLILLPTKGTLVAATYFCCSVTWEKRTKRTRRYKSHKSERPGYWARSFSSFPHQKKVEFTVGIENELQPQLSVNLLGSDPESRVTKDLVLLTTNGQSQPSLSLDNLSKFQSKTNAECQELSCERELSFHTNFLFCFCFLNNTPLLTFWFVKFFFLKLFNELFHCETGKSSDTETHLARQVQTTQRECKATL